MQRELASYETRLQEQRQLAAKGLEFLSQAQNNLAGVFKPNGAAAMPPVVFRPAVTVRGEVAAPGPTKKTIPHGRGSDRGRDRKQATLSLA